MTYVELKSKNPVAATLLRRQTPQSFHGRMVHLQFWEEDGNLFADDDNIVPETLVLRACSKVWTWESSSQDLLEVR